MWAGLPSSERERALRGIGGRLVAENVAVRVAAESLFSQVAAGDPTIAGRLRTEWVAEGDLPSLLMAAASFSYEGEIALVDEEVTVVKILHRASALGPEAFDAVRRQLHAGMGVRAMWVDPNGPSTEEKRLLDGADAIAAKYGESTEVGHFYKDLAGKTRDFIAFRTRHEQELDLEH